MPAQGKETCACVRVCVLVWVWTRPMCAADKMLVQKKVRCALNDSIEMQGHASTMSDEDRAEMHTHTQSSEQP